MNTISYILNKSIDKLKAIYPDNEAKALSYMLIQHYFNLEKHLIPLHLNDRLTESELLLIIRAYKRLLCHEPIQHVIGHTEFFDLQIKVTEDTLIPRPETEELIYLIKSKHDSIRSVLDIGTGSGCIPLALKSIYSSAEVTGVDVSMKALEVAKDNADKLNLEVDFLHLDILKGNINSHFDLIVSNPPYIKPSEKELMNSNVLDFEPHSALFIPETDPLLFYRRIVNLAVNSLNTNGYLYFEINENHGPETADLFHNKEWKNVEVIKDFLGKDRFVCAQYNVDNLA